MEHLKIEAYGVVSIHHCKNKNTFRGALGLLLLADSLYGNLIVCSGVHRPHLASGVQISPFFIFF